MMKKVIVTGANGFIGSHLIKRLLKENVQVYAISRSFTKSKLPEYELITKIEADLMNTEKISRMIPNDTYDAFYHLAWRGVNGTDKANPIVQSQNVEMTLQCAALAKKVGCKKFLCAGSVTEQSVSNLRNLEMVSGGMMYGVAKHCAHLMLEAYCKNVALPFVWMQSSNIYGVGNKAGNLVSYTLDKLLAGDEATYGPAKQPYDFLFVDDFIEVVYRIGVNNNQRNSYYIGSGEPRILSDYLLEMGRICGRKELIKIGVRPDDGIKYTFDMFDNKMLVEDVGEYVSKSFSEGIKYMVDCY